MGLLDWLFKKPNFQRVDDSFALTRETLWKGFKKSLESPQQAGKTTWLVVHFMDTFTQVQGLLEQWEIEYEIASSRLNASELDRTGLLANPSAPAAIKLILADLIPSPPQLAGLLPVDAQQRVAMIVLERHPQVRHDQRLEAFAKSLPLIVEFGYFLALDDAAVTISFDQQVVEILKQLGLKDELVSSNMVSKRLETVLKRIADDFSGDTPCNSAEEWIQVNSQ